MSTILRPLALTLLLLAPPADAADVCAPCPQSDLQILVEVPVAGRNYAGPTRLEGDIFDAFGRQFSVELVLDGALKPIVTLTVLNPGVHQFLRWSTAPLLLARGPHTVVITIIDLANPTCPDIRTVLFATR